MTQGSTKGVPIDTDVTLSTNSDLLVASQKATKTYIDTKIDALSSVVTINFTPSMLLVTGTTETIVGSLYAVSHTYTYARTLLGSTGINDTGKLRIRNSSNAALVVTIGATVGPVQNQITTSSLSLTEGWYDVSLFNSSISGSAACYGLQIIP